MSTPEKFFIVYYIVVNLLLFAMMGIDKYKAKAESWRIPEAHLFVAALLGGGLGGFIGMRVFHHKTTKIPFYLIFGISLVLHFVLLFFIFFR